MRYANPRLLYFTYLLTSAFGHFQHAHLTLRCYWHVANATIDRVKCRHSNLWSRYDLHVVGVGHDVDRTLRS